MGSGYKYLDIKNTNELELAPSDLTAAENIYICVGVYASNIILRSTVSLYNNNNKLDITIDSDQGTIFQFNEGNPTLTCLINGKSSNYQKNYSDEAFSFIWTKEDPEFGSILLNTTEAQLKKDKQREIDECRANTISSAGRTITQVLSYYSTRMAQVKNISFPNGIRGPKINCKLKNTNAYVTYSCSVYRGIAYIGYGSITLQNSKSVVNNNYYVTITNGTQVFQYDEAGIAPNSQRKQEPIEILDLVAVFHSPQGAEVTPKKVRWIMPEGKTLINIPSIGLETDGGTGRKYFVGNIFPLTIKDTYDNTCNDNQVTVIVTHNDGTEYRQTSNLLFTKIGEIGTNGTNTVVKINEPMNVPKDECLTIIKSNDNDEDNIFYNNGDSSDFPVLEASLYTNNTQVLGYTTNWSIAGSLKSQGYNYEVKSYDDNNNFCTISYNGDVNEIDTRIVKAEVNLEGKYFYSFYSIPAIEYSDGYNYENYPIKVMRDGTLRTVLYDSNGTNPIYDKTQGAHIELPGWSETGYINWSIESGVKRKNGEYQNPNFLLAISPKSEIGSEKLIKSENELGNIKTSILVAYDTGNICKNNASSIIKDYITDFLEDVEKICVDTLLSTPNKLSALRDRLAAFNDENNVPDNQNIYIKTVYQEYYNLFEMMQTEYDACKDINAESTKLYDKIQAIWRGMWPSVITKERLNIVSGLGSLNGIDTIEKLIDKYQQLYNNRSNDSIDDFDESDIFDNDKNNDSDDTFFLTLLNRNKKYYNEYVTSLGQNVVELSPILIRYAQVLMTYLNLLVEETQSCFEDNDLHDTIKEKYSFIYSDWGSLSNSGNKHVIGQTIYDIVLDANEEFASVSESICGLYKFYRELYLSINKYQIAEESDTLNTWGLILKGENPNLLNQIYVIPNKEFNGLYMNNNVVGEVYIKINDNNKPLVAKVYIPIIMTLNTYELASLNGWDGTSVEIGDNHILTPQIGAGIKDDVTNTFTGMVMGVIGNSSVNNNSNDNNNNFKLKKANKIGLIGYSNGKQSLFIDSETGEASFGLPEEDNDTENSTNEARIKLVPGGLSKIGNWKIGDRFLYNIVDGTYEKRSDKDIRPNSSNSLSSKQKIMVPHDKHGIILSSDQPYIHVKGKIYEKLNGINYDDEYNNINPGDSLELRMDPGDNSLFSIIQHTTGFGDEDNGDLLFGYKSSNSDDLVTIVKNYIANQNTSENIQLGIGAEYYVYRLITNEKGEYKPYYKSEKVDSFYKANSWNLSPYTYNNNELLKNSLSVNNFKRTISADSWGKVFDIDSDTGVITYNPNNLKWSNNVIGFSNGEGWQSITEETSSSEAFTVTFKYNKNIENNPITGDIQIGQIQNNTKYRIHRMKILDCTLPREFVGINLNDPNDGYIQFYVVANQNNTINNALLISDTISLWDNQNSIDVELFSSNDKSLSVNTLYYLKIKLNIDRYTINSNCSCIVKNYPILSYKIPPESPYGTIKITSTTSSNNSNYFVTSDSSISNIQGFYKLYQDDNKWKINFQVYDNQLEKTDDGSKVPISGTNSQVYDFILWRQGSDNAIAAGRTGRVNQSYSKFFTTTNTKWDSLSDYKILNYAPSENNPWCISFYPEGYCTTEIIQYTITTQTSEDASNQNSSGVVETVVTVNINPETGEKTETTNGVITGDQDITQNVTIENTETNILYKLTNDNIISMIDKNIYDIDWGVWKNSDDYNNAKASWSLELKNLIFGDILAFIPQDTTKLCIEENMSIIGIQGIPYAKTYWEKDNNNKVIQKVMLFNDYYYWINKNHFNQYAYIDVVENNNIYYKYIKTLIKNNVDNWFTDDVLPDNFESEKRIDNVRPWISIPVSSISNFENNLNWKEFIRIGIDENGRFYSAGRQDKRTYSRTGKIYSFGKVPNLYGQEIRAQLYSNNYTPIIKIFAQNTNSSTLNTTYITQGQNDNGNISIRTAGNNHYVELVASQSSNNDTNLIPNGINCVKVSYDNGVEIYSNNGKSKINLTNKNHFIVEANIISILSKDTDDTLKVSYNITNDGYTWVRTPSYVISSISTTNARSAFSMSLADSDNVNGGHYRINASNSNNNPIIQLQVGKNKVGLDITATKAILKSDASRFIEINAGINTKSSFNIDDMKLEFSPNDKISILKNGSSFIRIMPEDNNSQYRRSITLYSNLDSRIDIGSEIKIKGNNGLSIESFSIFKKNLYAKSNLYSSKNLYVGYSDDDKLSTKGIIYLYNDENKNYLKISAKDLRQLFDWYNNKRWLIGCYGNTVTMRNVVFNNNPEGEYTYNQSLGKNTYTWNWKTFRGYSNATW